MRRHLPRRERPSPARPSDEDGFTLIEVLVAAFILVLGALGVFMTFAAGIQNVQRAKGTQVAIDVAQLEMEKLRSVPYGELALEEEPPPPESGPEEADSPNDRVSGTEFALNRNGTELRELCIADGEGDCPEDEGRVTPGPTDTCVGGKENERFDIEGTEGQVYCYVTLLEDGACSGAGDGSCTYKRVTVAVWLDKPPNRSYRPSYYELQSDFIGSGSE